jgi:osmotically-inducible protein OsmY
MQNGVRNTFLTFVMATGLLLVSSATVSRAQSSTADNNLKAEIINRALNKSQYKNIQVEVLNSEAKLTGSVDVFANKLEADRRVHRVRGVTGVQNDVEVQGLDISDLELQDKLVKAIQYDRVGYGTTAFNAIGVRVQNNVVTLSGTAYGPVDADSAVSVASNTKGVRDVIDEIKVDPVSPADDRIRILAFQAIYGAPSLTKYAIDPGKPIRISVSGGNVTLNGVVNSKADRDLAGIRARGVPGTFTITNNLRVAGSKQE